MKKLSVLMLLAALFITTASIEAKSNSSCKKSYKKSKCCASKTSKASQYRAYAKGYMAKAKKAEAAGNKELAELYKQCAEAKTVMAAGYEGKADKKAVKAAAKKYSKAVSEIKKMQKGNCKKSKSCKKTKSCSKTKSCKK